MTQNAALTSPSVRRSFPWPPILSLSLGSLLTVTAELLPAGLLVQIGRDMEVETGSVGYLVTAWGVAVAVCSIPLTRATRRVRRRHVLAGSLLVAGLGTLLTALAPTFAALVAARMLAAAGHGLFWAQVVVAAGALAGEAHVARAVAVVIAGPTIASVTCVPALTAWGGQVGWRPTFALVGGLTAGASILLFWTLRTLSVSGEASHGRRDRSLRRVVTVCALGAVLLAAHFAVFTFIGPVLAGTGTGWPGTSLALLVLGVSGVAGLVAAPRLVAWLPAGALPATGLALSAALWAVAVASGPSSVVVSLALWGFVFGGLPVVLQTRVLTLASDAVRPMAGAVMVVALNLGIAAGAWIGGSVHSISGPGPLPALAGVMAALSALVLVLILARDHPREGPAHTSYDDDSDRR